MLKVRFVVDEERGGTAAVVKLVAVGATAAGIRDDGTGKVTVTTFVVGAGGGASVDDAGTVKSTMNAVVVGPSAGSEPRKPRSLPGLFEAVPS